MICVLWTKSVNFNRFKLWLERVVYLTRAVTLFVRYVFSSSLWHWTWVRVIVICWELDQRNIYFREIWRSFNTICDFFLQVLFKDEFNFSVYFGYEWIVHLYAHPIAASLHVLHDLTYLFHTKAPTPWTVGDTMQCCLLQKYGVIFTGRQSKAISLHSNFSTFWVESHFMGYMLTLSIQLKV